MNLGKSAGSILPGRGLINPAFVIKIVPMTDDMQSHNNSGRPNQENDYLDGLRIGDEIEAEIDNKTVIGKIQQFIKNNEGDNIYAKIIDSRGKIHKIEGSQIKKSNYRDASDNERLVSSPAEFNESKFISYNEFINK